MALSKLSLAQKIPNGTSRCMDRPPVTVFLNAEDWEGLPSDRIVNMYSLTPGLVHTLTLETQWQKKTEKTLENFQLAHWHWTLWLYLIEVPMIYLP
jgi:hypothetical protein